MRRHMLRLLKVTIAGLVLAALLAIAGIVSAVALPPVLLWHAGLMIAAWGLLLPLGALLARFFKVTPDQDWPRQLDNPFWWRWHRLLQYGGLAMLTVAAGLVYAESGLRLDSLHTRCGAIAVGLAWLQVIGGWLRGSKGGPTEPDPRGDHYDMTLRRRLFEAIHKPAGWAALAIAAAAVQTGLHLVAAPVWVVVAAGASSVMIVIAFAAFTRAGRWVDTYVAIWGPSEQHPGNRRRPAAVPAHDALAASPPRD